LTQAAGDVHREQEGEEEEEEEEELICGREAVSATRNEKKGANASIAPARARSERCNVSQR